MVKCVYRLAIQMTPSSSGIDCFRKARLLLSALRLLFIWESWTGFASLSLCGYVVKPLCLPYAKMYGLGNGMASYIPSGTTQTTPEVVANIKVLEH